VEEKNEGHGGYFMIVGFVLIHVSPVHEREVFRKLREIPEVVELHYLFGPYDLIAKIEASDYERLGEIVVEKIRRIDGILYTSTLRGLKFY
jgi:DNA-binding Lrp family transcriptional regulator